MTYLTVHNLSRHVIWAHFDPGNGIVDVAVDQS
jgi:hypothetical protein